MDEYLRASPGTFIVAGRLIAATSCTRRTQIGKLFYRLAYIDRSSLPDLGPPDQDVIIRYHAVESRFGLDVAYSHSHQPGCLPASGVISRVRCLQTLVLSRLIKSTFTIELLARKATMRIGVAVLSDNIDGYSIEH